jgi:phage shock protein PspC (stress-responsive transcriptional regulator)
MNDHLHRSRDDRMLAGVAGGLAEMWDADPSLVRLVWALLVIFTGGIALLVYIVMAIVVPEEDDEYVRPAPIGGGAEFGPPADAVGSSSPAVADASGSPVATAAAPDAVTPPPTYWMPGSGPSRPDARAARRAARRERRQRGDSIAPALIGVFLVLLGGFFLAREWLPELDWDWFWPVMLIALGVLLLVLALGRRPSDPGDLS